MDATLTEQDVKSALFYIGFDPIQVIKLTCMEGVFMVAFPDEWSGFAVAVALDGVDQKHDILKDNGSGVRAVVWPQPSGARGDMSSTRDMPTGLDVEVARAAIETLTNLRLAR